MNHMNIDFSLDKNGQVNFDSICIACENEEDEDYLEVCDYCGEPLGFCAMDCESLEEDFEE